MKNVIHYLLFCLAFVLVSTATQAQRNINQYNAPIAWGAKVNTFSGNFFFSQSALSLPSGPMPIDMCISYNSDAHTENQGLGLGWNFSYGLSYEKLPGGEIQVNHADGQQDMYTPSGPGFVPPAQVQTNMNIAGPGDTLTLANNTGRKVVFADSSLKKATALTDKNGNSLSIAYTDSLPSSITDTYGRIANLGWSGGKLRTMWEATSGERRVWFFRYEGDLLKRVSGPEGQAIEYEYDAENRLRSMTNTAGKTMEISYFPNGAVSGVYLPESGIAKTFSYDYAAQTCTMEAVVGGSTQTTTYTYDPIGNLADRTGSCCGGDISYTYDAAGNVLKEMDAKGYETTYTYDSKGNVLTQENAVGEIISYTYEPAFNQLATVTDPKGNVISYTYDADGNKIREDWPEGIVRHFGYNAEGLPTFEVNGNGDTTHYTYDAYGNRNSITYADGAVETFVHDARGNKISQTDANGIVTNFEYDELNRKIRATAPAPFSHEIRWEYDAMGNTTAIHEPLGKTTTFSYDGQGRLLQTNMPMGITHSYEYDAENLIVYTDPNGNQVSYTYDSKNRLASVTDGEGTRTFTYDANNNLTSQTDREGKLLQFMYDSLNQRVAVINAVLDTTRFTYDANGNIASETDYEGNTTTFTYDGLDRLTSTVDALGGVTTFTYDKNDNRTTVTDPLGRVSTIDYDSRNRIIREINALNDTTTHTYNAGGRRIQTINPMGGTTTLAYDVIGRPISMTHPDGEITTFTYDEQNNLSTLTLPNGNVQTFTYDVVGRKIAESDDLGAGPRFEYDANNNVTRLVTAVNDTIRYGYDELDRLLYVVYPMGDSAINTLDGNGNLLTHKDRNGHITQYTYDDLNRLLTLINGVLDTTWQTYDKNDQLTSVKDPNGNLTTYTYDALGRLVRTDYADGSHESNIYDQADNKIKWRRPTGDSIRYTYDALNRITRRDFPTTPDDYYHYNKMGLPDSIWNTNHTITFTYSSGGKTLSEKRNGQTTAYAYTPGLRTLTYPGGRIIREYRDKRTRLERVEEGATDLIDMVYDLVDRRVMDTYANGNISSYTYDNNNRLTRLTHSNPLAFWDVVYEHANDGSVTAIDRQHRTTHSQTFAYDNIMQLTESKLGTLIGTSIPTPLETDSYSYDDAGNRLTFNDNGSLTNYASNALNQYASVTGSGAFTPAYNGNGDQTYNGNLYFEYDDVGRLEKACSDPSYTIVISSYTYDPLDRMITSTSGGSTTQYYYDDDRVIEERTGATSQTYVYGNGIDERINLEIGTTDYFFHLDQLGNTVAMTNGTGSVVEQYEYDNFGRPQFFTAGFVSMGSSSIGNPYLYSGRRYDSNTSLYNFRARWYDPAQGRFLVPDPDGFGNTDPRTLHRYVYAANDPLNNTDPSGKNWRAVRNGSQNGRPRFNIKDASGNNVGVYVVGYGALLQKGNGRIHETSLNILQAHAAAKGCKIIGLTGLKSSTRWGGKKPPPDAPPPVDPKKFEKDKPDYIAITGQSLKKSVLSGESASSGARVIDECTDIIHSEIESITGLFGFELPPPPKIGPLHGKTDAYNEADGIAEVTGTTIRVLKAAGDVKGALKSGKGLKEAKPPVRNQPLFTTQGGKTVTGVVVDPQAAKDVAVNGGKLLGQTAVSGQSIKNDLKK